MPCNKLPATFEALWLQQLSKNSWQVAALSEGDGITSCRSCIVCLSMCWAWEISESDCTFGALHTQLYLFRWAFSLKFCSIGLVMSSRLLRMTNWQQAPVEFLSVETICPNSLQPSFEVSDGIVGTKDGQDIQDDYTLAIEKKLWRKSLDSIIRICWTAWVYVSAIIIRHTQNAYWAFTTCL